ncbi:MAG: GAF domain-containing protein [Chloroflexi bacterium]|nr:GAF domain-containing protein [Chloroflexota bacterium]
MVSIKSHHKLANRLTGILYIGQNASIISNLRRLLDGVADFEFFAEFSLADALTLLEKSPTAVILLELTTSPANSLNTLQQLRQQYPHKPVILLADAATADTAVHLAEDNSLDYLINQEFDKTHLFRAIKYTLNQQRLRSELAFINQVGRQLTSSLDLNQVVATTLEQARRLLDAMACSIWLIDKETNSLICREVAGPGNEYLRGWRLEMGQGIVGWVTANNQPVLIEDTWSDSRYYPSIDQKTGIPIRSMLCLPLQTKQNTLGALQLVDQNIDTFTQADLTLLESVASSAAIAIENAQLYEQAQLEIAERKRAEEALRIRNEELDRLYRASDTLLASTTPDFKSLAKSIVETVRREFVNTNCSLVLIDPDTDKLNRVAASGPYVEEVNRSILTVSGPGIIPEAIRTGKSLNVYDVDTQPQYKQGWKLTKSELCVPLKIDRRVIGAIDMQSSDYHAFNQDDERLLSHFADRAALALQSVRLFNETQRWAKELDLLNHIIATITAGATEADIFQTACVELSNFLQAPFTFLSLLDEEQVAQVVVSEMLPPRVISQIGAPLPMQNSLLFQSIFESGQAYANANFDLHSDAAFKPFADLPDFQAESISLVTAPIVYRGQVAIGSLILFSLENRAFSPSEVRLVKVVGEELGRALETVRLSDRLRAYASELEERVAARTEELHIANTRLVQALQSRDEFLASMSHELRTPLNAIMLRCELMRESGPDAAGQARSLHIIEESAQHLLELINDILDVAKIEAGKLELLVEPVPVRMICESSLRMVAHMAQKKQIELKETIDDTAVIIHADGRRIKQVLVNLLTNAVKFTPEGGKIGLDVRGNPEEDCVQFIVWDNGIGIDPDDMPRLFQPFVQLDATLSRKYSGTGLGLALVHRLVQMHHGTIELESQVGIGSKFTISLPWSSVTAKNKQTNGPTAVSPITLPASPVIDNSDITLLLVEDNEAAMEALTEYLATQGYHVVQARNGLEAVELAFSAAPDLILMDIQMPGLDGLEAMRRIRANPNQAATIIVAMTALVMPGDRERCLEAGANTYISKPISFKELNNAIKSQVAAR